MQQLSDFLYFVATNEVVTITVTPVMVGPFVSAATEGAILPNHGTTSIPSFVFAVNKSTGGTQIATLLCNFPGDTPNNAEYEIQVSGSKGGVFEGPTVEKSDPLHVVNLTFHVP